MSTVDAVKWIASTRETWAAEWTERPALEVLRVRSCLQPQRPSAVLRWRYGEVMNQDETSYSAESRLSLGRHYLKLTANVPSGTLSWYGRIWDTEDRPHGRSATASGEQIFHAFGLEEELSRIAVTVAYFHDPNDADNPGCIDWSPPFNLRHDRGAAPLGNAATVIYTAPTGTQIVFAGRVDGISPDTWSWKDIVDYLFANIVSTEVTWSIRDTSAYQDLDYFASVVQADGRSVRDILNSVLDRRRGFVWHVEMAGDESAAEIVIDSVLSSDITVNGHTVRDNDDPDSVTAHGTQTGPEVSILQAESARYDAVEVVAGRLVTCFSISYQDGTLERAWTAAEEVAYLAGAQDATGYASWTKAEKQARSDRRRAAEDLARVFRLFRIPADWDWTAKGGVGGLDFAYANPIYADGELDTAHAAEYWNSFRRILPYLPLEDGRNYASMHFPSARITGDEPRYMTPFAVVRDEADSTWRLVHALGMRELGVPNGSVRAISREMAVEVSMHPAYLLARNHWTGAEPGKAEPRFDWQRMILTVAMETDERLRVAVVRPGHSISNTSRLLRIFQPDMTLWYLLPQTVVGIDADGDLERVAAGATKDKRILRDDTSRARALAEAAIAYYGAERAAMRLRWTGIDDHIPLARLITTVDIATGESITANSIVSEITWNAESQTTEAETDFRELDINGLFGMGKPGAPTARSAQQLWTVAYDAAMRRAREEEQ